MNIMSWAEKRAQNLKWYHFGTLKIAVASAVLLVAKFIPEVLAFDWYWYVIIFAGSYVVTFMGFFSNPKDVATSSNTSSKKIDINDPCPCGSEMKFKHCHGRTASSSFPGI